MTTHRFSPSTIIVAMDGSDHAESALDWALANIVHSEVDTVVLLTVLPKSAKGEEIVTGTKARLQKSAERSIAKGVTTLQRVEHGDAREVISQVTSDEKAAMVVIGTRGMGGAKRAIIGSTAEATAKTCACPVVVVRGHNGVQVALGAATTTAAEAATTAATGAATDKPTPKDAIEPRRVAIAIDDSPSAAGAFDFALLHLLQPDDLVLLVHCSESNVSKHSDMVREFADTLKEHDISAKVMYKSGEDPRDGVIDVCESETASMLVMGSRGLGALKKMFLGSVSDYAMQYAPCPVIVVKHNK